MEPIFNKKVALKSVIYRTREQCTGAEQKKKKTRETRNAAVDMESRHILNCSVEFLNLNKLMLWTQEKFFLIQLQKPLS